MGWLRSSPRPIGNGSLRMRVEPKRRVIANLEINRSHQLSAARVATSSPAKSGAGRQYSTASDALRRNQASTKRHKPTQRNRIRGKEAPAILSAPVAEQPNQSNNTIVARDAAGIDATAGASAAAAREARRHFIGRRGVAASAPNRKPRANRLISAGIESRRHLHRMALARGIDAGSLGLASAWRSEMRRHISRNASSRWRG